jgi:hypothetical protein
MHRAAWIWRLISPQGLCYDAGVTNEAEADMPTTIATYPDYLEQVRQLVRQHRELKHEPLHLAVYYAPPRRAKRDVFLFEVIDVPGGGEVSPEGKLFEFGYGSTPGFPLPPGVSLRMVLTNPTEFRTAVRDGWKGIEELLAARAVDRATVVYADSRGRRLWESVR